MRHVGIGLVALLVLQGLGFSYTENLSLFMEKVLGFLELNGSFFTLATVPYEAGTPPERRFRLCNLMDE